MEMVNYPSSYKYLHSTMKKIRYYVSSKGISVSGKEILTHLFEEKFPSSNRLIMATTSIFKTASNKIFTNSDMYSNPFKVIKDLMAGSNTPFKDFYDYMKDTFKNMKFMEMNMVADFSCSGNFMDNLKKLMMTRSNPSEVKLFPSDKYTKDEESLNFLTSITLADYKNIKMDDMCLDVMMDHSKTRLERAMAIYKFCRASKPDMKTNIMIRSDRVEYSKKKTKENDEVIHFWTDYTIFIVAREYKNKVNTYFFSSVDMDKDEIKDRRIFNIFDKFKIEMSANMKRMTNMTLRNWSSTRSISYVHMIFECKIQVQRLFKKWKMVLFFLPLTNSSLCQASDTNYFTLTMYEDEYTTDYNTMMNMKLDMGDTDIYTIKHIMMDPPDIMELDRLLIGFDLLPDMRMPFSGTQEEIESKYEVQNILKQFNEAAESAGIITNMSRMFRGFTNRDSASSEEEMDMVSDYEESMDMAKLEGFKDEEIKEGERAVRVLNQPSSFFNPIGEGMVRMKEWFMKEEFSDLNNELVFEDQRVGKNMRRVKMSDTTSNIIRKSLDMSIDCDRKKMRRIFSSFKRNGNEIGFHNLLLLQINMCFNFSISDSMAVFIYNHYLVKMSSMYIVKPTYKVQKHGPEKADLLNDTITFLYNKHEIDEDVEDLIRKF